MTDLINYLNAEAPLPKTITSNDVEQWLRHEFQASGMAAKGYSYYDWSGARAVLYLAQMLSGGTEEQWVRRQYAAGLLGNSPCD